MSDSPNLATHVSEPIRYTLSFTAPHTHYVDVSAWMPTAGLTSAELMMAVWTPGSYLVREYSRHVEGVEVRSPKDEALGVEKVSKNRWVVETGGSDRIMVCYRVYCREMAVRTNWVEAGFALLNGAPTFLTLADGRARPHDVTIQLPPGWSVACTALAPVEGTANQFSAPDYDTLVDSPILLGTPTLYPFLVDGVPHTLVNQGEVGLFDGLRAARDLEVIVREHGHFWRSFPYDRYLFLNVITEAGGGLEHASSCVLMTSRWATRTRKAYLAWLEVASHELFHAWNVKRLRPAELGPFDYEKENYTNSLWVVEGITEYYGELAVHRAGLSTQEEYLEALSNRIETLQSVPGRAVQSLALGSHDAWIKHYRPDENSANASISYYTKGAVVAFLLDAHIRRVTDGVRSLDDVMREAYRRYAGARGYTQLEFRSVVEAVAGVSLGDFWRATVDGTDELQYAPALATFGLRFMAPDAKPNAQLKAFLGVSTRNDEAGRLMVSTVFRDTPAHAAGVNVDDEILAMDNFRVHVDQLPSRLEHYRPGDQITVMVARRGELLRLPVTLGSEPIKAWRLAIDPEATQEQQQERQRWLSSSKPRLD